MGEWFGGEMDGNNFESVGNFGKTEDGFLSRDIGARLVDVDI